MWRQLTGESVASYQLRNGITVSIRHRSEDMVTFSRIFCSGFYDPRAQIREWLQGRLRVVDLGAQVCRPEVPPVEG